MAKRLNRERSLDNTQQAALALIYLPFDIRRDAKQQREVETQLDHVVPVLRRQQRLQEERDKELLE